LLNKKDLGGVSPLAYISSPYAGNVRLHLRWARAMCLYAMNRGYAPFASHLIYTQFLADTNAEHRSWGIRAGLDVLKRSQCCFMLVDSLPVGGQVFSLQDILGQLSAGQLLDYDWARKFGVPITLVTIREIELLFPKLILPFWCKA